MTHSKLIFNFLWELNVAYLRYAEVEVSRRERWYIQAVIVKILTKNRISFFLINVLLGIAVLTTQGPY